MTSSANAALWLANEISQSLCEVFSSVAINPEITISFVFFQRVLPRFRLQWRKDEKCRARESLTAENHSLLLPGTEKSPCIISTEQGNISTVQHRRFLQCWTSGKRKKKKKSQRMVVSGEMQSYVPCPPLLLTLGCMGLLRSNFRRAF